MLRSPNGIPTHSGSSGAVPRAATPILALVVVGAFVGCSSTPDKPPGDFDRHTVADDELVGKWTTSNAPEFAAAASRLELKKSGEFTFSMAKKEDGKLVTTEVDGKKQVVRMTASGSWGPRNSDGMPLLSVKHNQVQGLSARLIIDFKTAAPKQISVDIGTKTLTMFRAE